MKDILAQLTRLYTKKGGHPGNIYRKKGMRPGTDWKVIVCTLFFLGVCIALAHVFVYNGVKNNMWWMVDDTNTVYQVKINKDVLKNVLDNLEANNAKIEQIKTGEVSTGDPSR